MPRLCLPGPLTLPSPPAGGGEEKDGGRRLGMVDYGRSDKDPPQTGRFQPSQSQMASPITSSWSRPLSHGNSSVNMVTHCR
jgi:hypothetical protein